MYTFGTYQYLDLYGAMAYDVTVYLHCAFIEPDRVLVGRGCEITILLLLQVYGIQILTPYLILPRYLAENYGDEKDKEDNKEMTEEEWLAKEKKEIEEVQKTVNIRFANYTTLMKAQSLTQGLSA